MTGYKYLYINQFDWKDVDRDINFNGEPKTNSVYLAENHNTFYRVILSRDVGLMGFVLEKKLMEGEYDNWVCDVEEVGIKNLLMLGISNKDLKMMAADVEETQEQPPQQETEFSLLDSLGKSLYMLKDFDPEFYEAVTSMTTKIADAISSPSYIQLTEGLSFHPQAARNSNVSIATYLLECHLNAIDKSELKDLLDAVYYLTLEVVRIHKMNKLLNSIPK